jgi:hypothetical protein
LRTVRACCCCRRWHTSASDPSSPGRPSLAKTEPDAKATEVQAAELELAERLHAAGYELLTDDAPRGVSFLYDVNRLNVAVSRAQALDVMVLSPLLLDAPARTPDQLRRVNAMCRLVESGNVVAQGTV